LWYPESKVQYHWCSLSTAVDTLEGAGESETEALPRKIGHRDIAKLLVIVEVTRSARSIPGSSESWCATATYTKLITRGDDGSDAEWCTGVDIQLKILQALPPLLQNYPEELQGALLGETLLICAILQGSKMGVVNNTAAASTLVFKVLQFGLVSGILTISSTEPNCDIDIRQGGYGRWYGRDPGEEGLVTLWN
jgi:hypothetical protein